MSLSHDIQKIKVTHLLESYNEGTVAYNVFYLDLDCIIILNCTLNLTLQNRKAKAYAQRSQEKQKKSFVLNYKINIKPYQDLYCFLKRPYRELGTQQQYFELH